MNTTQTTLNSEIKLRNAKEEKKTEKNMTKTKTKKMVCFPNFAG